jgi:hypothetical protein
MGCAGNIKTSTQLYGLYHVCVMCRPSVNPSCPTAAAVDLQIRGMHTIIRDATSSKNDFVFYADRLNRLIVEAGLGHLPFTEKIVKTPTGAQLEPPMNPCTALYVCIAHRWGAAALVLLQSVGLDHNTLKCCKGAIFSTHNLLLGGQP